MRTAKNMANEIANPDSVVSSAQLTTTIVEHPGTAAGGRPSTRRERGRGTRRPARRWESRRRACRRTPTRLGAGSGRPGTTPWSMASTRTTAVRIAAGGHPDGPSRARGTSWSVAQSARGLAQALVLLADDVGEVVLERLHPRRAARQSIDAEDAHREQAGVAGIADGDGRDRDSRPASARSRAASRGRRADAAAPVRRSPAATVIDAVIPGRWAAPPAPAMITRSPRSAAVRAYSNITSGVRCADTMRTSCGTPNSASTSTAPCMTSRSESLPMITPTSGRGSAHRCGR